MATRTPSPQDGERWEIVRDSVVLDELGTVDQGDSLPEKSGNPIGELQELCMSKKWPMPDYEEGPKTGPPHLPTFVITCTLNSFSFPASATSKKQAKKAAAAGMLCRVKRESPTSEARPQLSTLNELSELENSLSQLTIVEDDANLGLESAANVETLLRDSAEKLDAVLTSRAGSDIEGRSVWICELDGVHITGYGKTPQEARTDAARAVIHRLRGKLLNQ